LIAQWTAREDTDYTVQYHWQNIDNDGYDFDSGVVAVGLT
jgi:hypothetical protein